VADPVEEAAPLAAPAPPQDLYCPTCGAEVEPGESFCANCGASLDMAAPQPEIVPEEPIFDETPLPAAPEVEEAEVVIEEVVIEAPETGVTETGVPEAGVPAAADDELRCPICGANIMPDQAFCASCGAALKPEPAPEAAAAPVEPEPVVVSDAVPAPAVSPAPGGAAYVEIADSGAQIPLVDQPTLSVGRLDEISGIYPDIDLTPHGGDDAGVSRRHAQLIQEDDAWYVLDLDSTNGTFVNGVELTPKTRSLLSDGDQITMGELQLVFHAH
jgi:predicted nucleic acid-binding Zn ribbon protein